MLLTAKCPIRVLSRNNCRLPTYPILKSDNKPLKLLRSIVKSSQPKFNCLAKSLHLFSK
jgi:hypothetical protein